jgi:hypothetical protein
MPVIGRCLSEPVRERVEREDAVVNRTHAHHARIDVLATPIAPEISRGRSQHCEADEEDEQHAPPLLPAHDHALAEVAHTGHTQLAPRRRLDEHPHDMALPEPAIF